MDDTRQNMSITNDRLRSNMQQSSDDEFEYLQNTIRNTPSPDSKVDNESYDKVPTIQTNVPLLHMSYLLHLVLPRRYFGKDRLELEKEKVIAGFEKKMANFSDKLTIIPVGSRVEGYFIPDAIKIAETPYIEYLSDIDAMYVQEGNIIPLMPESNQLPDSLPRRYIDIESVHSGYARICYTNPSHVGLQSEQPLFKEPTSGRICLKSSWVHNSSMSMLNETPPKQDSVLISMQGPALSAEDPNLMTNDRSKICPLIYPQDSVTAFPCADWPQGAREWAERVRSSDWLKQTVVDKVIGAGFHVVPISHRLSLNPDIEWRISFAVGERILSEEAVSASQRQCYVYLKMLRYEFKEELELLSSYCFKNIFLYSCETLPVELWDDEPSLCVLTMIERVIEGIQKARIPSYFIPENNLIDHLSLEDRNVLLATLQKMREDPISPIIKFCSDRFLVFPPHEVMSNNVRLVDIIQNLTGDVLLGGSTTGDIESTIFGSFTDVQVNIASVRLAEQHDPFTYHLDFYDHFVSRYTSVSIVDFFNYLASKLKSSILMLTFYDRCLKHTDSYPELNILKGNLACMCFVEALTDPTDAKVYTCRINQADTFFKQTIASEGPHSASVIDYVNFLCYKCCWNEAIELLDTFIDLDLNDTTGAVLYNGYSDEEIVVLDSLLQYDVKTFGNMLAPSMCFAYYFLVKAYIKVNDMNRAQNTMTKFAVYHKINEGNETETRLLGYAAAISGEFKQARGILGDAIYEDCIQTCKVERPKSRVNVFGVFVKCTFMLMYILQGDADGILKSMVL